MNAEEIKAKFEEMVAAGTTNWTKQTWDSIGVEGKKENKQFLADYPRSKGIIKFIFEEDEKARISGIYYTINDHLVMVNYAYTDDNKVKIVAFAESTLVADLEFVLPEYDPNAGFTEHDGYYFKGYKKVSKDWLCFCAEDGTRFENPEGHVTDFLAEGVGFAPAISADKLPKILELAKENGVEIC